MYVTVNIKDRKKKQRRASSFFFIRLYLRLQFAFPFNCKQIAKKKSNYILFAFSLILYLFNSIKAMRKTQVPSLRVIKYKENHEIMP